MKKESNLQQKFKVLIKLYDFGCKSEKDLQLLTAESLLQIPNIAISDMRTVIELQKCVKANKLFSYLGENENGSEQ